MLFKQKNREYLNIFNKKCVATILKTGRPKGNKNRM